MKSVVIGIAGGSASGKTTVADKIVKDAKSSVLLIRLDDYYKDQSDFEFEERVKTNYDHPFAFEFELLFDHIRKLENGESIEKPIYDFKNHTRSKKTEIIHSAQIIIIEGLFVLENELIRNLLDIKLYVHTAADIRFIRRLVRDINERGRTNEDIIAQYLKTVRPMHRQFVEPSKRYADVIIPEGGENDVAIDLITTKINDILS